MAPAAAPIALELRLPSSRAGAGMHFSRPMGRALIVGVLERLSADETDTPRRPDDVRN